MTLRVRATQAAIGLGTCSVLVLAPVGAAGAAGGAGTTHESFSAHKATNVFYDFVPCHPDLGGYQITAILNSQFHDTENVNGDWETGTDTGPFSAVPVEFTIGEDEDGNPIVVPTLDENGNVIPRAGETFTGHFTDWFGGSVNRQASEFTDTFSVHGDGSAGTTFQQHAVEHITFGPGEPFDPATAIKVAFNKSSC